MSGKRAQEEETKAGQEEAKEAKDRGIRDMAGSDSGGCARNPGGSSHRDSGCSVWPRSAGSYSLQDGIRDHSHSASCPGGRAERISLQNLWRKMRQGHGACI